MSEFSESSGKAFVESRAQERSALGVGWARIEVVSIYSRRAWLGFPHIRPDIGSSNPIVVESTRRSRFTNRETIINCNYFNQDVLWTNSATPPYSPVPWTLVSPMAVIGEEIVGATQGKKFIPTTNGIGAWEPRWTDYAYGYNITGEGGINKLVWADWLRVPHAIPYAPSWLPTWDTLSRHPEHDEWSIVNPSFAAAAGQTRTLGWGGPDVPVIGWNVQQRIIGDEIPVSAPLSTMCDALLAVSTVPSGNVALYFRDWLSPSQQLQQYGAQYYPQVIDIGLIDAGQFNGAALPMEQNPDIKGEPLGAYVSDSVPVNGGLPGQSGIKSGWWWNPLEDIYLGATDYTSTESWWGMSLGFPIMPYVSAARRWVRSDKTIRYFIAGANVARVFEPWEGQPGNQPGTPANTWDGVTVMEEGVLSKGALKEIPFPSGRSFESVAKPGGTLSYGKCNFIVFGESPSAWAARNNVQI